MSKTVHYTTQFKKDFKLCIKRGYNMQQINSIMKLLESGKELPGNNKDHNLTGNFLNCRECHVQSDWLMIYQLFEQPLTGVEIPAFILFYICRSIKLL